MNYNKQINVIFGKLLLTIFVTFSAFNISFAAAGDLDLTFNGNGKVITHIGDATDDANDSAVQSDGKLVVVGTSGCCTNHATSEGFAVARYNVDGSLDRTFNGDGKVLTQVGLYYGYAYSVAIQSDDKILVAGEASDNGTGGPGRYFVTARYNRDGSLDTSFADNGIARMQVEYGSGEVSIAIGPDGKIVVAGNSPRLISVGNFTNDTLIVRYNANGSLDTGFDNDGIVITPHETNYERTLSVAIQPDGKILSRGYKDITRYNTNGSIDVAFGINGKINVDNSYTNNNYSIKIQPDGKIITIGYANSGNSNYGVAVFKFNTSGSPDLLFGNNGIVLVGMNSYAYASIAVQTDGKILLLEDVYNESNVAIIRLNTDGTRDLSFDGDGTALYQNPDRLMKVSIAVNSVNKIFTTSRLSIIYSQRDFVVNSYNSDGSKNTSFGRDGKVKTGEFAGFSNLSAGAVQPDGKIVTAGYTTVSTYPAYTFDFAVVRYNANGTLDTSFNQNGKVRTAVGNLGFDRAYSVAVQSDGKIVVAGTATFAENNNWFSGFAIVRYNPDGSLDNSFDGDGKMITQIPNRNYGYANSVLIQPDGKIVAAGTTSGTTANQTIVRYNSDGSLDNTFGDNGVFIETDWKTNDIVSLAVNSDGKFVTLGTSYTSVSTGVSNAGFAVARYNANGTPDNTFGIQGKVISPFDTYGQVKSLKIQIDGKIIAAGTSLGGIPNADTVDGSKTVFTVFRYNADGNLDNTFDGDGKAYTGFEKNANLSSISIQADNKIVVAGNTFASNGDALFAVAGYMPDGSLDSTFDNDGKLTTGFNGKYASASSTIIQPNGKIIVGGTIGNTFGLVRYQGTQIAANAGISGRITTASGRGIRNVSVQISGGNLSEPKFARTNAFGYYRFQDLQVGQSYVVGVAAKRYSFANPIRVITLNEDLTGEDFVSNDK